MTKYVRERQTLLGLNSSFVGVASMPEIYVINRMHHARHGTPWRRRCDRSHGTRLETFKSDRRVWAGIAYLSKQLKPHAGRAMRGSILTTPRGPVVQVYVH